MPVTCRRGISRAELLVVLLLGSMLLGLLLPAVQGARQLDHRKQSENNLKQIGLGVHNMESTYGFFPPVVGSFHNSTGTIFSSMLPFIEQDRLYTRMSDGRGSFYVWHNDIWGTIVKTFVASGDTSAAVDYKHDGWLATSNYAANYRFFKSDPGGSMRIADIVDGMSITMMFAERYRKCGEHVCAWGYPALYYWAPIFAYYSEGKFQPQPAQKACDAGLTQSLLPDGILVCMGDGSVKLVADTVSPRTWWLACTPNDGQQLDKDW